MSVSFSPERCADLHNQLLRKTIENIPGATPHTNLFDEFLDIVDPDFAATPNLMEHPPYKLLSLLEIYDTDGRIRDSFPLTPQASQPTPPFFFHEVLAIDHPNVILLYPYHLISAESDAGLFFDLETCKARWHSLPNLMAPPERWVSLENVLRHWLELWDRGKYRWDPNQRVAEVRSWVERDIIESITAWNNLVSAIEIRIPKCDQSLERFAPLKRGLLDQFSISPCGKQFLSRVQRPKFQFLAPGITTFSPETFESFYASEPATSARLRWIADSEPDEWPALLLPAMLSLKVPFPAPGTTFDKNWDCGKFTVMRQAGLYTDAVKDDGDSVFFVDGFGQTNAFMFSNHCPWGPSRRPKISEVLDRWAELICQGVWEIGEDGVRTPHEWFRQQHGSPDTALEWPEEND